MMMLKCAAASWTLFGIKFTADDNAAGRFPGLLPLGFILGGNLIPLLGVLFWGWDIFPVFVLYWLENIIIGIFMILKLLILNTTDIGSFIGALFLAAFFTFHYGMFCMGHGVFVFALFGPEGFDDTGLIPDFAGALDAQQIHGFIWAIIAIFLAEAVQTFRAAPFDTLPPHKMAGQKQNLSFVGYPYARIIILHLTLIGGGLASEALGQPVWALAVLIILKTTYDLGIFTYRETKRTPPPSITARAVDDKQNH